MKMPTDHFTIKYLPPDENYTNLIAKGSEQAYHNVIQWFSGNFSFAPELSIYPNLALLAPNMGWNRDQKSMGSIGGKVFTSCLP